MTTAYYFRTLAYLAFQEDFRFLKTVDILTAIFKNVKYIKTVSDRWEGYDRWEDYDC